MADAYWRYNEAAARLPAAMPPQQAPAQLKRPRPDYPDMPTGPEMHGYYGTDNGRATHQAIRDNDSLNASYDRYLRNGMPTYAPPEGVRPMGGMPGHPVEDFRMMGVGDGRNVGVGSVPLGRQELPPDASNTVFVEGLPANCTRREVSHIFRPFVGFREVRLVNKESRHPGGDPLVLCFVDFETPNHAAVALEALQDLIDSLVDTLLHHSPFRLLAATLLALRRLIHLQEHVFIMEIEEMQLQEVHNLSQIEPRTRSETRKASNSPVSREEITSEKIDEVRRGRPKKITQKQDQKNEAKGKRKRSDKCNADIENDHFESGEYHSPTESKEDNDESKHKDQIYKIVPV